MSYGQTAAVPPSSSSQSSGYCFIAADSLAVVRNEGMIAIRGVDDEDEDDDDDGCNDRILVIKGKRLITV